MESSPSIRRTRQLLPRRSTQAALAAADAELCQRCGGLDGAAEQLGGNPTADLVGADVEYFPGAGGAAAGDNHCSVEAGLGVNGAGKQPVGRRCRQGGALDPREGTGGGWPSSALTAARSPEIRLPVGGAVPALAASSSAACFGSPRRV